MMAERSGPGSFPGSCGSAAASTGAAHSVLVVVGVLRGPGLLERLLQQIDTGESGDGDRRGEPGAGESPLLRSTGREGSLQAFHNKT